MDCSCHHAASEHAPRLGFGEAICLVPDCDCQGTPGDVAAQNSRRFVRMSARAEKVYRAVREVLSTPRTLDDQARNVAAAIVATFECEAR